MKSIKSIRATLLSLAIFAGAFAASTPVFAETEQASETAYQKKYEQAGEQEDKSFVIAYPDTIKEVPGGEELEDLVLPKRPERIVVGSSAPVQLMHDIAGASLVAISDSKLAPWAQEWPDLPRLSFNHGQVDVEKIVEKEPDLVMIHIGFKDQVADAMKEAGIPVYYVNAGHTVPFESIREESQALLDSFVNDDATKAEAERIMGKFIQADKIFEEMKAKFEGKTCLVMQGDSEGAYVQTAKGTLGNVADHCGFKNLFEGEVPMAPMDPEQSVIADPECIFSVGRAAKAEEQMEEMKKLFASNEEYWNQYSAVKNDQVVALPSSLVTSYGYPICDAIQDFADCVNAKIK
ncbi:MAG: ABC transporter substrate-binding protein [Eubacteriales bacterium]|nr:ABC transporter substrate-binding protein [Eubacteriales bacterium]